MSIAQSSTSATRGPACPVCNSAASSWLCKANDYDVWRCAACATDFVNPLPTPEQLKALYDRESWFEGGEHGGYASYDEQTDSTPGWLAALLDRIGAERSAPSILDIGCAYGTHLELARARGWQCFGVEPSQHARDIAVARHPEIYFTETVEEVPPHRFDVILLLEVIEHLPDPYALFYELMAKDAIGPETVVAVTTPNARSADALRDPAGWKYRHPPSHLTFYSAESFATLFRRLRFTTVDIVGQHALGSSEPVSTFDDEKSALNPATMSQEGLLAIASGSDFAAFMQERYVPGTWSEIAAYEHRPRYALACALAAGKRVLDFGCGSGYGAADLAQVAAQVIAIDISEDALSYAREHHKAPNLTFERRSDLGEGLPEGSFDLITCFELIEHLERSEQLRLLTSLDRLLTPDGLLIVSTPNPAATAHYGENPFHLHEMSETEFRSTLTASFPEVSFLGQVIAPAVMFLPDEADGRTRFSYSLIGETKPQPAVFVAVCGKGPIGELPTPVFFDPKLDYISIRTDSIKNRNRELLARYEMQRLTVQISQMNERHEREFIERDREFEEDFISLLVKDGRKDLFIQEDELSLLRTEISLLKERLSSTFTKMEKDKERSATELRVCKAEAETLSQLIDRYKTELSVSEEALSSLRLELEEARSSAARAAGEAETLAVRLHAVESSTTWRAVTRLMPVLRVLRPVLHPLATAVRRVMAATRTKERNQHNQLLTTKTAELTPEKPPLDLLFETCRVPEWDEAAGHYQLRLDETRLLDLRTAPAITAGLIKPYKISPLMPIPSDVHRPRILHVIPNVFVGGSTQLIIDIMQHLSHRYEQEVLTSALWRGGDHTGMPVHCVPRPDFDSIRSVYRSYAPDLVHVHYWGLTDDPWYKAAFAALDAIPRARIVQNVNTPVAPLVHPRVDHYVYVSSYVRTHFGAGVDGPESSSVIYPGIDLSRFSKPYDGVDARNAIGMVYRLEEDKLREDAIDLFIEIVRRRPRTRVVIVGGGTFLQPYIQRTIDAGVRENFHFTGYVPYEMLPDLYDQFSIFVAPVWKESFGQVSPFAMAKGLAVAGYSIGALTEIIGRDDSFGETLEEAAAIVVELLNDPERLAAEGERNRVRATGLFSVEAMVDRYDSVYARLTERNEN